MGPENNTPGVAVWVSCDEAGAHKILLPETRCPAPRCSLGSRAPGGRSQRASAAAGSAMGVGAILRGRWLHYSGSSLLLSRTPTVLFLRLSCGQGH